MRVYKIYASAAASGNAAAYVTIQKSGRLKSIRTAIGFDCVTDNGRLALEVSLGATSQIATNDSIGPIHQVEVFSNFLTSGLNTVAGNDQVLLDFPVNAGERIYLNVLIGGTVTYYATVFLDVQD